MAERLKAHAWKACVLKGTVGSNPTLSAIQSAVVETSCAHLGLVWEIPAIPRGFGRWGLRNPNQRQVVGAPNGAIAVDFLCARFLRFGLRAETTTS